MVVYYKIFWVDSSLYGPPLKSMGFLGAGINSQRASGRAGTQVWSVPGGPSILTKPFKVVVLFGTSDDRLLMSKCKQAVMEEKRILKWVANSYTFF